MKPRNIIVPVLVLGLAGVGLYAAPCLMGACADEPSVAASEQADAPCDAPCDTPCEPPCDSDKAKAVAAGDGHPCPHAEQAKAEANLAAVQQDAPCPHALGQQAHEPQLAAQAEGQAAAPEPAPVDGAAPRT